MHSDDARLAFDRAGVQPPNLANLWSQFLHGLMPGSDIELARGLFDQYLLERFPALSVPPPALSVPVGAERAQNYQYEPDVYHRGMLMTMQHLSQRITNMERANGVTYGAVQEMGAYMQAMERAPREGRLPVAPLREYGEGVASAIADETMHIGTGIIMPGNIVAGANIPSIVLPLSVVADASEHTLVVDPRNMPTNQDCDQTLEILWQMCNMRQTFTFAGSPVSSISSDDEIEIIQIVEEANDEGLVLSDTLHPAVYRSAE